MTDNPVRPKFGNRPLAVAKIYGDNRNASRTRRANVCDCITDHDGGLQSSVGGTYRASQYLRIRLLHAEGVLSANRNKAVGKSQISEQSNGQCFELVRANSETATACGHAVKSVCEPGKGKGSIGEMFGIMRDELFEQLLKPFWRKHMALGIETTRDHHPSASAHKIPRMLVG